MVQQIWDLGKWKCLQDGEFASFEGDRPRTVRIELNAPDPARVYINELKTDDPPILLCRVMGRDTVSFSVNGPFEIQVDAEVWFYTADGMQVAVEKIDHESFTRIVERRVRNPELELMMYTARINMERRLEAQAAAFEQRLERKFAQHARQPDPGEQGGADNPPVGTTGGTEGGGKVGETPDRKPPGQGDASDAGSDGNKAKAK